MRTHSFVATLTLIALGTLTLSARAAGLDPAVQAKVDAEVKQIQTWAADPAIVAAVKEHNTGLTGDAASMTQDKWKGLSLLDPFVRSFTKNPAAAALKTHKDAYVTEAFVSGNDGTKVAFLSKTSGWSHKGKAKHDDPMAGKTWQGEPEVDDSTGMSQVQVSVPVLDGATPVGSLVVGLDITKLKG